MQHNDFKGLLNAHLNAEQERKNAEEEARAKRIAKYKEELNKWNEKVREWIDNINSLLEYGYPIYSPAHLRMCNGATERHKKFALATDAVVHGFGCYGEYMFGKGPARIYEMGIAQGGCCGDWFIHTDGNEWWIQHKGERCELRECDYEDIFHVWEGKNRLERFEDKFNELIEYLKTNS